MRHTRRWLAKAHRWGSFALGLLLLVVVISGVVLLLDPEIEQVTHPSLYDTASGPTRLAPGAAKVATSSTTISTRWSASSPSRRWRSGR